MPICGITQNMDNNPKRLMVACIFIAIMCCFLLNKFQSVNPAGLQPTIVRLQSTAATNTSQNWFTSALHGNQRNTVTSMDNFQHRPRHQADLDFMTILNQSRPFSCRGVVTNNAHDQRSAQRAPPIKRLSPAHYSQLTTNCTVFKQTRHYIVEPLSNEEANFSIAYSILMYRDLDQTERLLRAIYRPQNYYCIHVDKKSGSAIHEAMASIAECFPNVFIASVVYGVRWGTFDVLQPELKCMEDLWNYKEWRYFINLTGQEFPLKTNLEIVKILKIFNGANNVEGSVKRFLPYRIGSRLRKRPPFNVTFTYGSVHIVVQRGFVDYLLHNQTALYLTKCLTGTTVPDETLFTTLNYNPQLGVPGSYKGEPESEPADMKKNGSYPYNPFLARFKNWRDRNHLDFQWPCKGYIRNEICIFGVGDLPMLAQRPELFANKFYADFQPHAYDCLERRHYIKTYRQLNSQYRFQDSYYKHLEFIHNVVI